VLEKKKDRTLIQADRLEKLMAEKKLTQDSLGPQVGLSQSMISCLRRGIHAPSVESLARLARFFGVSTDWLLGLTDRRFPDKTEAIEKGMLLPVRLLAHIRRQDSAAPQDRYILLGLQDAVDVGTNDLILAQSLGTEPR
jgi:transcriptional regulator with XRE-family HTH domain